MIVLKFALCLFCMMLFIVFIWRGRSGDWYISLKQARDNKRFLAEQSRLEARKSWEEMNQAYQTEEVRKEEARLARARHRLLINEMSGYDFEVYAAKLLSRKGFKDVGVTAKSGDFGADILAIDPHGEKICFQCKKYSSPVGVKAVQEISAARSYYKCGKAAVVTNASYTPAARELAHATGVFLYHISQFE